MAANKDDAVVCRRCGVKLEKNPAAGAVASASRKAGRTLVKKPLRSAGGVLKSLWSCLKIIIVFLIFAFVLSAMLMIDGGSGPGYPQARALDAKQKEAGAAIYDKLQENQENMLSMLEIRDLGYYLLCDEDGKPCTMECDNRVFGPLFNGVPVGFQTEFKDNTLEFVFTGHLKGRLPVRLRFICKDAAGSSDGLKIDSVRIGMFPLFWLSPEKAFEFFEEMLDSDGGRFCKVLRRVRSPKMDSGRSSNIKFTLAPAGNGGCN